MSPEEVVLPKHRRLTEDETESAYLSRVNIPSNILSDCWVWTGRKTPEGYGQFRRHGIKTCAHRFSYETYVGAVSGGMVLDHLCRNRGCQNPNHLEPVENSENLRRGIILRGSKKPQSKLTEKIVSEIRKSTGAQKLIGKKYGVTQACISDVVLGKTWRHVS